MAIRSRAVRPDAVLETSLGPIPHVSDAAFYQAVMDAATTVALAGGEFRVVVQRVPTEFANESVTVAALIEWRNHTSAKAQPEPHVEQSEDVEDLHEELDEIREEHRASLEDALADEQGTDAIPTAVH